MTLETFGPDLVPEDLCSDRITKIAIGDPAQVPAGEYAQLLLASLGLLQSVQDKFVFAKDARKVLEYVETGLVDAGFVYRTDAQHSGKVRVVPVPRDDLGCARAIILRHGFTLPAEDRA
nr:molybdate ABC transporter substrate-binding protein [uncultured Holophaga sp.]